MKKYALGIDIGGTTIKLGFFTIKGQLLNKWEIETRTIENGKYILEDVSNSIFNFLENNKININDVVGAGIGVPGPVKSDGTVKGCVNLGWPVFNVAEALGNLLGIKVKVANDANIAALGEMFQGGGKGYNNMIMVTLGTGVGGAVIIDGKIIPGFNGAGGEIGHINVNPHENIACNCKRNGCLEQYASATGIVRMANEILEQNNCDSKLRNVNKITAKEIFDAAKENDGLALQIVEKFSSILGRSLSNIACICDPEVFVIGGGVSKAGDILINSINKYYKRNALYAVEDTQFKLAILGNDAGIYGGAKLAQEI